MNTRWTRWLMMSFLVLQFVAVATDAHQFSPPHAEASTVVIETTQGTDAGADTRPNQDAVDDLNNSVGNNATAELAQQGSSEKHSSSHDHCPHCCHCHWHAVASVPVLSSQRHSAIVPPYHITFHSQHPSAFFRPPRLA